MRARSITILVAVPLTVAALLAGCGPKPAAAPGPSATGSTTAAATVKVLNPGNCTLYSKDQATALLGVVNDTNPLIPINTAGGQQIDVCFYGDLGVPTVRGVGYAVVQYDSAATAQSMLAQVKSDMLDSASSHDWQVTGLTVPTTGTGPVLGGYGTKSEDGIDFTLAVVGTNVGPYLVAVDSGSTVSAAEAQQNAVAVLQALLAAVS
jgi:hypothetical protein